MCFLCIKIWWIYGNLIPLRPINMQQHLSITAKALDTSLKEKGVFKNLFATSADVVMKASGLHLEAIRAIAREQGVEIEDTACRCIDESLLAALADAHVRRMKAYFNNAKRHIASLGGNELATYTDFCQTFKKRQSSDATAQSWTDIDADAIREQFLQKIHVLTPNPLFELFSACSINIEKLCVSQSYLDQSEYKHRCEVVEKVLNSHLFYEKSSKTQEPCVDIRSVVRRVTLSARYHIFSSEDDDHQQDAIDMLSINRAPAMVA